MPILDIFDAIIRKDEDTLQSLLEKRSRDINKISLHNHTPPWPRGFLRED